MLKTERRTKGSLRVWQSLARMREKQLKEGTAQPVF
jgi:hypothetical protein